MASISISTPSDAERRRGPTWLQGLATATVISVFVLVIIGGVVRVTGSGLGCPDWPLCYGKLLPPLEYTAIIEYTHRFVASVIVGPLVLVTAVVGIARYRTDRWVWVPAVVSVPLLIVQGLLGGITVLTHLPGGVVALHLATAEALLATCVFIMMASYRTPIRLAETPTRGDRYHRWAIVGALSVYVVIVSGALVTAMGATGACVTWPLCQGQAFPMNHLTAIHMFHRYVVLALGGLLLYSAWRCWNGQAGRGTTLKWLVGLTVATFIVQVIVGAATIWLDFQAHWRALHLTAATAVWTAAAGMAIVAYMDVRTTGGQSEPTRKAGQNGQ
ncbi:Heme A synthase [Geodia barretti]|jgi:heme A synthase|uniref:Heme A synthase n=1 Tax=Geodia barretti TaxID=519541 RepID=A0AA35RUW2_GEOBA|nr:Heme A synthase [Geodia barretti]